MIIRAEIEIHDGSVTMLGAGVPIPPEGVAIRDRRVFVNGADRGLLTEIIHARPRPRPGQVLPEPVFTDDVTPHGYITAGPTTVRLIIDTWSTRPTPTTQEDRTTHA